MVRVRQPGQVEQRRPQRHPPAAHVVVAADQRADVLRERPPVEVLGDLHHLQVGVGHAVALALRESQQQQDDVVLLPGVEAPDHPEVHQRQLALVGEEDVAGVRVAVEDAVDHHLLQVG